MTTTPITSDLERHSDAERDLVVLFSKSLRLLGEAGYPDAANRLAAKAWWALKEDNPQGAMRVSGVMHYLAKLPEEEAAKLPGRTRHKPSSREKEPTNG